MGWPLSQDYNLAIQSPASNFADPELRRGEAVVNALGLPQPYSGTFADVYQVRTPDGERWAVKCFTREAPGLRERYREISRHLAEARLPFSVDFSYLEQGIRVAGRWFPVLKMQWVEGLTLNQFVAQYADKPAMLDALSQIWQRMGRKLRDVEIAHCDLQHGNVLLVPGTSANSLALKLVDYDGMWVPALAGRKSGEVGHPSYQHPERLRVGTYSFEVDRFSLLLIATALTAVRHQGRGLWDKYDNGDNMLFVQADLGAPTKSRLFLDLVRATDPHTRALADHLLQALRIGLASAPLLDEVLPETAVTSMPRPARSAARPVALATGRADPWDFDESAHGSVRPRRPRTRGSRMVGCTLGIVLLIVGLGTAAGMAFLVLQNSPGQSTAPLLAAGPNLADPPHGTRTDGPRLAQAGLETTEKAPRNPVTAPTTKDSVGSTRPTGKAPAKPDRPLPDKPRPAPRPSRPAGPTIENSLEMELVQIPAGKFRSGSPAGPRPFYMGVKEVIQFEYEKVMGTNPSHFSAGGQGMDRVKGHATDLFPVENVTWNDAIAFCKKLSELPEEKKAGRSYRLPTEEEWEYACRADTTTAYFFGDDPGALDDYAWFGDKDGRTHLAGKKTPNGWGLFDMYGNVREWCQGGVCRGGAWDTPAGGCRSAARIEDQTNARDSRTGFRVVCEVAPQSP